jgi:hypothetical protein
MPINAVAARFKTSQRGRFKTGHAEVSSSYQFWFADRHSLTMPGILELVRQRD